MKQIIQDIKSGKTILEEIPAPSIVHGEVLIQTKKTLVSTGTEKMLVNFGKAGYIGKIKQQPEKFKLAIDKIKSDGIKPTLEAIFRKLDEPIPLGYSNSGIVIGVGNGVKSIRVGDRVACNGYHAEIVSVPENLVAKIPDNVSYEDAAFTVVGSIGLQGIRLLNPTFGETIVVYGLGVIGLISAQILKSNGCNVIGIDLDEKKLKIADKLGIKTINPDKQELHSKVNEFTSGIGADGVLITASSKNNTIINDSAKMSRKRGRVILIGVVGLDINRSEFYDKEIIFQVSCSYGPGRYDSMYEDKGLDYPIGFVRWTEKRNFNAFLGALSNGLINLKPLISKIVPLENYFDIYNNIDDNSIANIIKFDNENEDFNKNLISVNKTIYNPTKAIIGIVGAGDFTSSTLLPNLKKIKTQIKYIVSAKGLRGTLLAKKYNIDNSSTDFNQLLNDKDITGVIISTRHNLHSTQVIESLKANKHTFVEKPLAINLEQLLDIKKVFEKSKASLMVGFNRRFSPLSIYAKKVLGENPGPINVIATMNAGFLPSDHWTQDIDIGGGRIIGEACHYIDLISFLSSSRVKSILMTPSGLNTNLNSDNGTITLKYDNGSLGVINYFSNGHKSYSKERIEIYQSGKNIIIDNFKKINFFGYNNRSQNNYQDKGHYNQFKNWNSFLVTGGEPLIKFESLYNTTMASLCAVQSIKSGNWINV